jgi:hypothetical protein
MRGNTVAGQTDSRRDVRRMAAGSMDGIGEERRSVVDPATPAGRPPGAPLSGSGGVHAE